MKTLIFASPHCIAYDDGEPLGNRGTTVQTLLLLPEVEWAPGRGGVVLRGHRISLGHIWRCAEQLGWSAGYIAGQYGVEEATVAAGLAFAYQHPELIEPDDDDSEWWVDSHNSSDKRLSK